MTLPRELWQARVDVNFYLDGVSIYPDECTGVNESEHVSP